MIFWSSILVLQKQTFLLRFFLSFPLFNNLSAHNSSLSLCFWLCVLFSFSEIKSSAFFSRGMLGVGAAQVVLVVKNPLGNAGDIRGPGLIPGLGRSLAWQSIRVWRIWWTEEPVGLQPTGLQRVWYDWSDIARLYVGVTSMCIYVYVKIVASPLIILVFLINFT